MTFNQKKKKKKPKGPKLSSILYIYIEKPIILY